MMTINNRRTRLLERLREIDEQNAQTKGNNEISTVMLDRQSVGLLSRVDALQRQQMAKETYRRRLLGKAKISAALERLDQDEYGWCADCGSEISEQRLEVDLTAHLCIECAK